MNRISDLGQSRSWLETLGIVLCGVGLVMAFSFAGIFRSEEVLARDKQEVLAKRDEMKSALTTAKVPADQIPGLMRVHESALVGRATDEDFIIFSFLILSSLLVASVGWTLILWARVRALTKAVNATMATTVVVDSGER